MNAVALQNKLYEFNFINRVLFGVNSSEQAGEKACELVDGRNCLIITDSGVYKAGVVEKIKDSLINAKFDVYVCDDVENEPTLDCYKNIFETARDRNPDIIFAVGGGSSIDIGKTIAAALKNSKPIEEYVENEFEKPGIPLVAMPTTAGTGADITADAVVLLPEQKIKGCFLNVQASMAIIDPALMVTVPPRLTAATGVDALSHAIESALTIEATPMTQALALESIRIIFRNLRKAVFEGSDLEARTNMAWATMIEAFSEGNAGDCEGHAVAHILGGYYRIHHGEACSIALPYCMKYNLPVNLPILTRIAQAMDETIQCHPSLMAEKGILAVQELINDVGSLSCIADIEKAKKNDIPDLVNLYCTHPASLEFLEFFARRGIPTKAEATRFFEEMFEPLVIPDKKSIS